MRGDRKEARTPCGRCGVPGFAEFCADCRAADPAYFAGRGGGCASVTLPGLGRQPMKAREWSAHRRELQARRDEFFDWARAYADVVVNNRSARHDSARGGHHAAVRALREANRLERERQQAPDQRRTA